MSNMINPKLLLEYPIDSMIHSCITSYQSEVVDSRMTLFETQCRYLSLVVSDEEQIVDVVTMTKCLIIE
jgi:hypothetical protein